MNLLVLDLETYYDREYSLKKLSTPRYVRDPRFHVHGLAIRWPDGTSQFVCDVPGAVAEMRHRFGDGLERTTVVCHNAAFDLYVLNHVFDLRPRHFVDTMLLAYHVHGRPGDGGEGAALADLAERYGLADKLDLAFTEGVRDLTREQLDGLTRYALRDVELTYRLALRLLPRVSRPGVELPIMMHTVRLFTERGVRIDLDAIPPLEHEIRRGLRDKLLACDATEEVVSANSRFAEALTLELTRTGRSLPTKPGKNGPIPATAKTDHAMQLLVEDGDPRVAALAGARLEKKASDQKLARLGTLRETASACGGVLPVTLVYCGAHTGRFAGGGGFNIQNLPRAGVGGQMRSLLVPRPGHVFVIGDLSQIEARIVAWLADEASMLEAFAQGRDIYCEFAREALGWSVRKPGPTDSPEEAAQLKARRQVGKQAVLGLGFGMGARKFVDTLKRDRDAATLFGSGELDPAEVRRIVDAYRGRYTAVPALWRRLEQAMRDVVIGKPTDLGKLGFEYDNGTGLMTLPSGRLLRYPRIRTEHRARTIDVINKDGEEEAFHTDGFGLVWGQRQNLYGGMLCENAAQAIARDLLVEAILRLEALGMPVVFHVHDEAVLEVPRHNAAECEAALQRELSSVPEWAAGLPIACEVGVEDRYTK